jgi:hypothetical protein
MSLKNPKTGESAPFTLRQAAAYDHATEARSRLSAWGIVSRDRHTRGVSRKQTRLRRNAGVSLQRWQEMKAEMAAAEATK